KKIGSNTSLGVGVTPAGNSNRRSSRGVHRNKPVPGFLPPQRAPNKMFPCELIKGAENSRKAASGIPGRLSVLVTSALAPVPSTRMMALLGFPSVSFKPAAKQMAPASLRLGALNES